MYIADLEKTLDENFKEIYFLRKCLQVSEKEVENENYDKIGQQTNSN